MKDRIMDSEHDKCQRCGGRATFHVTEIIDGNKVEKHLCEKCAAQEGVDIIQAGSISDMLEKFILEPAGKLKEGQETAQCDVCGITFGEVRRSGRLGCPIDYDAFEKLLQPMLERAQAGATHHTGKVPRRAKVDQKKHNALLRLRAELKGAVATEDYERAAAIRDEIKELEGS